MQPPTDNLIEEALKIKRSPARSRKITAVMAIVAVLGIAFLLQMKTKSDASVAEAKAAKIVAQKERDAANVEINNAILQSYRGLSKNGQQKALVARVGSAILTKSDVKNLAVGVRFHLLAEPNSINVFALSTGDVYVTTALLNRMQTEGQLAAALAHGAAHTMNNDLPEAVEATQNLQTPSWYYSQTQEDAADKLAVKLMGQAGYDPGAMIGMFTVLLKAYETKADVSFFTTHPNQPQRLQAIQAAIEAVYPQGIPQELSK